MIKIKLPIQKKSTAPSLGVFIGEGELAIAALDLKNKAKIPRIARTASIHWGVDDIGKSLGVRLRELVDSCGVQENEIALSISGQDAFVRRYELPMLPKKEWQTAARFEARKYMPFEISDLQCQTLIQKTEDGKRLEVVFTAVRKDILKTLIDDFTQSGFKVMWAEPVFMSLLRLFLMSEEKSTNEIRVFIEASKNGTLHTVFAKNETLLVAQRASVTTFSVDGSVDDESYLSEVQLAFDYFNKSFRRAPISGVSILRSDSTELQEKLQSELKLPCEQLDLKRFGLDSSVDDGSAYRAAGAALASTASRKHKFINLLSVQKIGGVKKSFNILSIPNLSPAKEKKLLLKLAAIECALAFLLIIVCIGVSYAHQMTLNHGLKNTQKKIALLDPKFAGKNLSELKKIKKEYEFELTNRKKLERAKDYLTPKLNLIAKSSSTKMELSQISYVYSENLVTVNIAGTLSDTPLQQGVAVINQFVGSLQVEENGVRPFDDALIKSINEIKQPDSQPSIVFVVNTQKRNKA